jgi:hypothetical protein
MKKIFMLSLILLFTAATLSAGDATKYGKKLTLKNATPIADLLANPEKYKGKRVQVEGTVTDVCAMRGCWIKIGGSTGADVIRFKVEDGVIEFPKEAKGKSARAEGIFTVAVTSVEDQIKQGKHEADEQGKKFDPKTVTGVKTVVQIKGEGAEIR